MGHVRQEVKRANEFLMKNWNIEAELQSEIAKVKRLGFDVVEIGMTKPVYNMLKDSYCVKHNIPAEEAENIELRKYEGFKLNVLDPEYFNNRSIKGFGLPFTVSMELPEAMLKDDFYGQIESNGSFETLKAVDTPAIQADSEEQKQLEA